MLHCFIVKLLKKLLKTLTFFSIIVIDQLTKNLVSNFYPNFVSFNQGVSFGWGSRVGWQFIAAVIIVIIVIALIGKFNWGFLFILAGGMSNLVDRIVRGEIVDWIRIPVFPWSFNLADVSITVGLIMLILQIARPGLAEKC